MMELVDMTDPCGEIGRHNPLKRDCLMRAGSSPVRGTIKQLL